MALQIETIEVIDRVDGQPSIILANGNWAQWSNELKKYVDTGARALPEDDAIKYFKLTNTSETPPPVTQTGGWGSIEELDAALIADGWSLDPKSVAKDNRFQWISVYQKEQLSTPDAETGMIKFVPKFSFSVIGLYNNFAPSPVVTFDEVNKTIIITNPDGSEQSVKIPTPESVKALSELVAGLKKQVDKAIYSYESSGVPTMDGAIVMDWLKREDGTAITDDETKADVFSTHVGDMYTDLDTNLAYRFSLKEGGVSTNPADYEWKLVKDGALTAAISRINEMEGSTVKIWTTPPADGDSYKQGDLLLYQDAVPQEWRYKTCIKSNTPPQYVYSAADWVEPYATLKEVADLNAKYDSLSSDLSTAKENISDLTSYTDNLKSWWTESAKDNLITAQEKANLDDMHRRIDEEQSQLQSNVDYILTSQFFTDKDAFTIKANAVLAPTTGSIDKLQTAITDAVADSTITEAERTAVTNAWNTYNSTRDTLLTAIKEANTAIDAELKRLADERVDNIEIGGRNLLLESGVTRTSTSYLIHTYDLTEEIIIGETYTYQIKGTPKNGSHSWLFFNDSGISFGAYYQREKYDEIKGVYYQTFVATSETSRVRIYSFPNVSGEESTIDWVKLEKGTIATDWTPAPEDVQAEIDAINANPPRINPDTKNWEVYKFVDGVGKYVDTGDTSIGDDGKAPEIRDGYWWIFNGTDYVNSEIKAQGEDGQDALSVKLARQGEFYTTYRTVDASGNILPEPQAVKKVRGGVNGKVVITAVFRKGIRDVTANAVAGGNLIWYLNGTQIASGTDVLTLGVGDHVDGETDDIQLEWDDANAGNW